MAARLLRHAKVSLTAGSNAWFDILGAPVPAGRALVGKLIVTPSGAGAGPVIFEVGIDVAASVAGKIIGGTTSVAQGQNFTETGLVIPAGERIWVFVTGSSTAGIASFFGEEVDN